MPFKRGTNESQTAAQRDGSAEGQTKVAIVEPVEVKDGQNYPPGTTRIEVEGRTLELKAGTARAALEMRAGRKGEPGLLLVTENENGAPILASAMADGSRWSDPEPIATLLDADRPGCNLRLANVQTLGASYALVSAELECPTTTRSEHHLWIATLERKPRMIEHLATIETEELNAPRVVPAMQARDLDGDGNADLLLVLDVLVGDQPPTRIELKLFHRAGGLARDTSEPEKTVLALADQAKDERKRNPGHARSLAQRALGVHSVLCRASGASRFYLGGSRGLDCGASLGAGRAASILVALSASDGKLLDALDRYQTLQQGGYRLAENDWERAKAALHTRIDEHGYAFRPGPALTLAASPRVRHRAVAFIDETHLLLRGVSPRSYDLMTDSLEPTGIPAEIVLKDPSGRFAISTIVRDCEGYRLSIVPAAEVLAGVVTGVSISRPLLARADAPLGAACPNLSKEQQNDDGGFRVLDWTKEGVLIARGTSLFLLALDASASTEVEARLLAPDDPMPTLPCSDELTPDGRFQALVTSLGIAIVERKTGSTHLIALPEGTGQVTELAVSPSGRTIALLRGDKLWIGAPRVSPTTGH